MTNMSAMIIGGLPARSVIDYARYGWSRVNTQRLGLHERAKIYPRASYTDNCTT
jgi:hypothetical protein